MAILIRKTLSIFIIIAGFQIWHCKSKSKTEIDVEQNMKHKVFELKFVVPAGTNQTFYHDMKEGETLTANFAVVESNMGQDLRIGFLLIEIIEERIGKVRFNISSSEFFQFAEANGDDATFLLCFANEDDLVNDKTIIFYMDSYKIHNWENTDSEMAKLVIVSKQFKQSFDNTKDRIETAIKHVLLSRLSEAEDLARLEYTYNYVNNWACTICLLTVILSVLQVFFAKTLFAKVAKLSMLQQNK